MLLLEEQSYTGEAFSIEWHMVLRIDKQQER